MMQHHFGQQNQTIGSLRYTNEDALRNPIPQENRELPIHARLEELEQSLHRLHETIEMLQRRLECVSCPQPPLQEKDIVSHPGGSGMAVQIIGILAMAEGAGVKLRRMYDALEV